MIQVSSRYPMIACRFMLPQNTSEATKKKYKGDPDQCLTGIVVEWLKLKNGCSWKNVICAIAARVGGDNPRLAERVAQEYRSKISVSVP